MTRFKPTPDSLYIQATEYDILPGEAFPPTEHYHEFYELYYLQEGERRYFFMDRAIPIGPGTLVAVPPFSLHKTSGKGGFKKIQVLASSPVAGAMDRRGPLDPLAPFLSRPYPLYHLKKEESREWEESARRIARLTRGSGGVTGQIALSEYYTLMLKTALWIRKGRAIPLEEGTGDRSGSGRATELVRYLSEHYREPIRLNDLGDKFGLHPKYICHLFREETGLTLGRYRNFLRIREAERLMEKSALSLEEIARSSGFSGLSSFGRVFKDYRGTPPGKWRRREGR